MSKVVTKKFILSFMLATALSFGIGFLDANNFASANTSQIKPLQGKVVSVPAGTVIPVNTTMILSSENLVLGQSVSLALSNNFYYNNSLIAPLGSFINGTVTKVKKAGRAGINGQLMITFTNIVTPYGQMIPIYGTIQTDDGTGLLVGGTKKDSVKEYAKDMAIGSAAGAVTGVIMGPLAGGEVGRGAAYGTAVGAGLGLAKSLWDKGDEATIPVGTPINIILNQQATFTQQQGYQY